MLEPIPLAVTYRAYVCDRSFFEIAGSKPAEFIDVFLTYLLRIVQVAASGTSWSPVQRSSILCVCLI